MEALDILIREHNLIRRFLENLNIAYERLEFGTTVPVAFFEKATGFAREFTDKFHHFKEEYVMFGLLAAKKDGSMDAQLEALRNQHERGRNMIAAIKESLAGYEKKDGIKTEVLLTNLAAYITLLRDHIHREDHIFFPLVRQLISEEEHRTVLDEFAKVSSKDRVTFEKNEGVVNELGDLLSA